MTAMQQRLAALERRVRQLERAAVSVDRNIGAAEVCRMLGVSRATLYRREANPDARFPRSFLEGGRRLWSLAAVRAYQLRVSGQ